MKLYNLNTAFPIYNTTVYELYQDPDQGKVIADFVITTTAIAFIYKILSILNVWSINVIDREFVLRKNVHRGST